MWTLNLDLNFRSLFLSFLIGLLFLGQVSALPSSFVQVECPDPHLKRQAEIFFSDFLDEDISDQRLSEALKRFFLKYPVNELRTERLEGGRIHVVIKPRPLIRNIEVNGLKTLKRDSIKESLNLREKDELNPGQLEDVKDRLKKYLHYRGFPHADVSILLLELEDRTEADLKIDITENEPCIVEEIDWSIDRFPVTQADFASWLNMNVGDRCDGKHLEQGIENIRSELKDREFLSAAIDRSEIIYSKNLSRGRLVLEVRVGSSVEVRFRGNTFAFERDSMLRKAIALEDERKFNQAWVEATAISGIKDFYRKRGYPHAQIQCLDDPASGSKKRREIVFEIERGPKVRLEEIHFHGNRFFPEKRLQKEIYSLAPEHIRSGTFVLDELNQASYDLIAFYQSQGFLRAKISEPRISFSQDQKYASASFEVSENERSVFSSLRIQGNRHFSNRFVEDLFQMKDGDPINPLKLMEKKEELKKAYQEEGFKYVDVQVPDINSISQGRVTYEVAIQEGPLVHLRDVIIRGNRHTEEYVIRRELSVAAGDRYDPNRIRDSRRALLRLGFFESVSFEEMNHDPTTGQEDLLITLREKKKRSVRIRPGFSTDDGARGAVELGYINIAGTGRSATAQGRVNRKVRDFRVWEHREMLTYREPHLIGPMSGHAHFINERAEERQYDIDRRSVIVGLNTEITRWFRPQLQYELEFRNPFNIQIDPAELSPIDEQSARFGSVAAILDFDRRNDVLNPTEGSFHRVDFGLYHNFFWSEADFYRLTVRNSMFFPLYRKIRFVLSVRFGFSGTYGKTTSQGISAIPIEKRFRLGGNNSLRGFGRNCIGGVDSDLPENCSDSVLQQAPGGNSMFNFMAEVLFPLFDGFDFAVFSDGGNAYVSNSDFNPFDIRNTAGVGLRYNTFFGPLRLDFGIKLDRRPGESFGEFHFAVGQL